MEELMDRDENRELLENYEFSDEGSGDDEVRAVVLGVQVLIDADNNNALQHHNLYTNREDIPPRGRILNFYELIIPSYTGDQFHEHFRMYRETFTESENVTGAEIRRDGLDYIPLRKKILLILWLIATPDSIRSVADRFGISKSETWYCFHNIVLCLKGLLPRFVQWPNEEECVEIERIFIRRSRGFPVVVGSIDGCHIRVRQPFGNIYDYYNRKNFHSIILQGICDHRGLFRDCLIGRPGRAHDAAVFRSSRVYTRLTDIENPLLPPHLHIIGDSAYPLLKNVMTPFRDDRNMNPQRARYNVRLSCIRSIIERAFGQLKMKWRRLCHLDVRSVTMANNVIAAACTLHNSLILHNELNINENCKRDDMLDDIDYEAIHGNGDEQINNDGRTKRFKIMNSF